jgi:Domain of unknown function (DUF4118)
MLVPVAAPIMPLSWLHSDSRRCHDDPRPIGGFWPGMLATILSVFVAWFVFITPEFSFSLNWPDATSLLVFISTSLLLVGLITLADDWLLNEIKGVAITSWPRCVSLPLSPLTMRL